MEPESHEQHLDHIYAVFRGLTNYELVLNVMKCVIGTNGVEFLGFQINEDVILPSSCLEKTTSA